jgi:hypothetical protein
VLNTIQTEYGIEIVDENDHRFWTVPSLEAMSSRAGTITAFGAIVAAIKPSFEWRYPSRLPRHSNADAVIGSGYRKIA